MGRLTAYNSYKKTGIEWVSEIPQHWEVKRAKRIFAELSIKGFPNEPLLAATQTKGVVLKSKYENRTVVAQNNLETLKLVEPGNFVISLRSFQGGIELAHDRGIISPAYTVLKLKVGNKKEFFKYFLKSKEYINSLTLLVTGIREGQNIDTNKFKESLLFAPSFEEQTAIAHFLDYKTAKINRFIRKKKQLIKLLNEQKAAIINQAVTKGLNPDVKMKDSGIEWLGEIPEHWEVTKLSAICSLIRGNSAFKKDELLPQGEYVALQYGKTYKVNEVNDDFHFYVNEEFYKDSQTVNYGDVIIVSTSETMEDLGHSVFYNRHDVGLLGGEQISLKPNSKLIDGKYLCFCSNLFTKELRKYATGVKVYRFNINDLKTIYTPTPTIQEQQQIVSYIEAELTRVDRTISTIEKEIALVEEYKTALITEAVTGKIDVRDYQFPETETENEGYEELEEELALVAEESADYQTEETE